MATDDGQTPGATLPKKVERSIVAPRIEVVIQQDGKRASSRTMVLDGDLVRIGSHPTNEVVLDDPMVSRFHCRLTHDRGTWRLNDTGSLNGTRVGGMVVRDADLAMPESVLEIGDSILRVHELIATKKIPILDVPNFGSLYGTSNVMRRLFAILERVAQSESNVLIEGESGTGKELIATEIVKRGPRAEKPFVVLDCSAMAPNLLEGTLFGHARGAFTGADRDRAGIFEAASGGTVFLDEIGELPLEMQPKLLRVLEAGEITRLGETSRRAVNVRVLAATNRRLENEMNAGRFREDLYFRLSVIVLRAPPLRERSGDFAVLVPALLESLGMSRYAQLFPVSVIEDMERYDWPGNVRELRNYLERAVVMQTPQPLTPLVATRSASPEGPESVDSTHADPSTGDASSGRPPVDIEVTFSTAKERVVAAFERAYAAAVLRWADGNVSRAARKGGVDRMTMHRLITRYDLRLPRSFRD